MGLAVLVVLAPMAEGPTMTTEAPATTDAPTTTEARTTTTVAPASTPTVVAGGRIRVSQDASAEPIAPPTPSTSYPERGTVGFLGDPRSLLVVDGSQPLPPGAAWDAATQHLEITATQATLDGVYLKGGVSFFGRGTLTIRHSIVEGGWGWSHVVIAWNDGATIDVRNSTLRWRAGATPEAGSGTGAIQIAAAVRVIAVDNDVSGTPAGMQLAGDGTLVEHNWIHDLALLGEYPNNSHNDGLGPIYHGAGMVIRHNRIEIGWDGVHQTAAVFFQPGEGGSIPGPQVVGNLLSGGGYTLRFEGSRATDAVVRDNVFDRLPGQFGDVSVTGGATIAEWSNNRHLDGSPVPRP